MVVQIRGTRFAYQTAVAAPAGNEFVNNALRDIIPDKPFKLHGYDIYMNNHEAELLEIQLYKNIAAAGGPVAGGPVLITHGVIQESVLYAADTILNEHAFFDEPIRFDKDDSLSVVFQWGLQGAGKKSVLEIVLLWSEGK